MQLSKSVVLVGMMGAGKTTVGTRLAEHLQVPFFDTDHEIEKIQQLPVAQIFEQKGETYFREQERMTLRRILSISPCIIATGGGIFMAENNRYLIAQEAISIYLSAELSLLYERIQDDDTVRPLLMTADPKFTLQKLYHERVPCYATADLTIPVDSILTVQATVDLILDRMTAAYPMMFCRS
ncbi:MAG: shikimate kinase [Aestuariivita sp.]|nr:shikimate kinase [Aestuariivita sp.]